MKQQIGLTGRCDLADLEKYVHMEEQVPEKARRDHVELGTLRKSLQMSVGIFGLPQLTHEYNSPAAKKKRALPQAS